MYQYYLVINGFSIQMVIFAFSEILRMSGAVRILLVRTKIDRPAFH